MPRSSPTLSRRRLGKELEELREAAELSAENAAAKLRERGSAGSKSKISRIERAQISVTIGDVERLLDIYGVADDDRRDALLTLARQARERGWWSAFRDVFTGQYVGFETSASVIRNFETTLVPGLLQTSRYAYATYKVSSPEVDPGELDRRVAARMSRRLLLDGEDAPRLWAVIDEAALRRPVGGPEVMREQIENLIQANERTNITIQVLPISTGEHPGMNGSFVLLDFPDPEDRPIVFLEAGPDGLYLDRPEAVEAYKVRFEHLVGQSEPVKDTAEYLSQLKEHFSKQ